MANGLQGVRVGRGADVGSDLHIVTYNIKLEWMKNSLKFHSENVYYMETH